jgi:hypothetical protein
MDKIEGKFEGALAPSIKLLPPSPLGKGDKGGWGKKHRLDPLEKTRPIWFNT